jgi:hypothetical protein
MSRHFTGSKYDEKLSTTEIAKRFRADVKAALARGELPAGLKLSVATKYYAGGSSIHVEIKVAPGVAVMNPERLRLDAAGEPTHGVPWMTPEAAALADKLDRMLSAYNYDNSDTMTDYFDVNFYKSVDFAWELRDAERDAFEAGREARAEALHGAR